jgi:hypothetical protein
VTTVKRVARHLSWPPHNFTVRVKLPLKWVHCPLCGKHLVCKGRAHPRLCSYIRED